MNALPARPHPQSPGSWQEDFLPGQGCLGKRMEDARATDNQYQHKVR